jgi:tRNA(adenine34) deaminase
MVSRRSARCSIAAVNYDMFMRSALAEAAAAASAGEMANGAIAVLDEAMVAHGREQILATGDPTAHAVVLLVREAARRLGRRSLEGVTVFAAVEPCAMCVGALLQSDADAVIYSLHDPFEGACGSALQLADAPGRARRLRVVSGILSDEAAELRPDLVLDLRHSAVSR